MPTRNTKFYSLILLIADFIVLLAAFTIAYFLRVKLDSRVLLTDIPGLDYLYTMLTILPFWLLTFAFIGLYSADTYNRRLREWSRIGVSIFIGILLIIGWEYVTGRVFFPARLVAVYAFVGSFTLLVVERELLRFIRSQLYRYGRGVSRVLLIGTSPAVADIASTLSDTARSGYRIVAIAGPKKLIPQGSPIDHFSSIEVALKNIDRLRITTIIQTDLYDSEERNQQILTAAQVRHIQYNFIPGEPEFYTGKNTVDVFLGYPIINVSQTPLIGWGSVAKRVFDLVVSSVLIVILSPVFLTVIILQQLFNPGPVLFKHERLTRYSKSFPLYKFRSMSSKYSGHDAAQIFKQMGRDDLVAEYRRNFKVENDPRITKFGHFLRNSSLDELPQLFNVLKGDLSLVGPRPVPKYELDAKLTRTHGALLLSVRSGITGLWQVSGRSDLSTERRIQLELYYVQNWSFWLDIKILFKTVGVVLRKTGAK